MLKKILLVLVLFYLTLSLVSYNPVDPSLNTVSNYNRINNVGGKSGAYISDLLLQLFGLTALLFPIIFWHCFTRPKNSTANFWILLSFLLLISAVLNLACDKINFYAGGIAGMMILSLIEFIPLSLHKAWIITILALILMLLKFKLCAPILKAKYSKKSAISTSSAQNYSPLNISKNKYKTAKLEEPNQSQFDLPPLSFLSKSQIKNQNNTLSKPTALELEQVLRDFKVKGSITEITVGPVVTLYELLPIAGTKTSRVIGLAGDIARSMKVLSTRIATIPGKETIGIELPNANRDTVYLGELIEYIHQNPAKNQLPIALGKAVNGMPIIADLGSMPHLLIAGTTGSGKSVALNSMIVSLLYSFSPKECKFIMIDPKMLELSIYEDIPHLMSPVIINPKKSINALKWVTKEMENRYRLMSQLTVRNISGYNYKINDAISNGITLMRRIQSGFDPDTQKPIFEDMPIKMEIMPFIVVIIDEMADLMLVAGKEFEHSVQRLAQMGRASGIHIIAATQRPSVDVITGVIKANFPTRISFAVTSKFDSRTIIGAQGAEQLLGMGDMLYMPSSNRLTRIHGPFISEIEVQKVVNFHRSQGSPNYINEVIQDVDEQTNYEEARNNQSDELYEQAVQIVKNDRRVSTSYIQRKLQIGYNRAANLMEIMEKRGLVSPPDATGKRKITSS